jgi:hypothetical protein
VNRRLGMVGNKNTSVKMPFFPSLLNSDNSKTSPKQSLFSPQNSLHLSFNSGVRFTKESYPKICHKYVLSSSLRDLICFCPIRVRIKHPKTKLRIKFFSETGTESIDS